MIEMGMRPFISNMATWHAKPQEACHSWQGKVRAAIQSSYKHAYLWGVMKSAPIEGEAIVVEKNYWNQNVFTVEYSALRITRGYDDLLDVSTALPMFPGQPLPTLDQVMTRLSDRYSVVYVDEKDAIDAWPKYPRAEISLAYTVLFEMWQKRDGRLLVPQLVRAGWIPNPNRVGV